MEHLVSDCLNYPLCAGKPLRCPFFLSGRTHRIHFQFLQGPMFPAGQSHSCHSRLIQDINGDKTRCPHLLPKIVDFVDYWEMLLLHYSVVPISDPYFTLASNLFILQLQVCIRMLFQNLFTYLFVFGCSGLCCCALAFSSGGEWGLVSNCVGGLFSLWWLLLGSPGSRACTQQLRS